MTEMELRRSVVMEVLSWLGGVEGGTVHKLIVDTYNGHKPLARGYALKMSDAWCAGTVSAAAISAGLTDIIPTEVSCSKMIELARKMGIWKEADNFTPQMGDILMYDWEDNGKGNCVGAPNHVGYVWDVADGYITVLEGNMGRSGCPDHVGIRPVALNGRYIRGFITPDYAGYAARLTELYPEPQEPQAPAEAEKEDSEMRYKTIDEIPGYARETVQGLLDSGVLLGKGGDEGLDLSEDMVRVLVMLDRAGMFTPA